MLLVISALGYLLQIIEYFFQPNHTLLNYFYREGKPCSKNMFKFKKYQWNTKAPYLHSLRVTNSIIPTYTKSFGIRQHSAVTLNRPRRERPPLKLGSNFIAKNTRQFYGHNRPDVPEVVSIQTRLCLGLNVIDIADRCPLEGY